MNSFAKVFLLALAVTSIAAGQTVTINESFNGTTTGAGWSMGGSGYTPVLTAAQGIDPTGSGWLRLTSNAGNEATYALDTSGFASKNATIAVTFNYASYNGSGADGITFFLADASKTFAAGAYGGSLGYAQKTAAGGGGADINGMNGGYIGVGIDEFGNYSNPTEGRIGGTGSTPNAIAVRGPGSGLTGYNYLGGTTNLGANSIAFPSSTTRPTGANARSVEIVITATNQMTVYLSSGGGAYVPLYSIDLSGYTRPDNLVMGFTSGTGGSTDIHEIQNVSLASVTASLWTASGGDGLWGTGTNWVGNIAPATYTDVLLDNTYVSSAQAINLGGATRTVRSLLVDAPFSYTLGNGNITFNSNGVLGPSGIFVSATHGSASQTINANLTAANAIEISNGSSGTLALGGTLNNGGNAVTFSGSGDTTASGVVSGAGALIKNDGGNLTLSGANAYSGGTTLNAGTLTANNNSALGSGTLAVTGGTLASTTSASLGNIISLQGDAAFSGLTTTGTLTQTSGSYTLNLAGATQSGTVNLSDSNTAHTLTAQVDSGTSTISGVIQNGGTGAGGLTKTGAGTLVLSGANTYTGATTVNTGTLQLGASNVLANASSLNLAGGTLNLNKFSDAVGNLSFSNSGTLDFGAGGTNSFVFANAGTTSGVLTIADYASGSNYLGSTTGGLSSAFLNSLYFSGLGAGATEAGSLSAAGNGLGNAYQLTPTAVTWNIWKSNVNTAWTTNTNWTSGTNPNGTSTYAEFGTGTQGSVVLGSARTVGAIRFDATGPVAYNISGTSSLTFNNGASPAFIQQQSSRNETISTTGGVVLGGNLVADTTGSGSLTVSSVISGAHSLTKTGTGGTLVLSGANTFTGGVAINNGVVQGQNSSAFGTGTVTVAPGSALELSGGIAPTNALTLSGTGVSAGGALRNVSGNNTASGNITLNADTRINSDAGTLTLSGTTSGSSNLNFGGAGNITVSGKLATGTGAVTVDGTGTVALSGTTANTYTGDTTVNSGTLNLSGTAGTNSVGANLVVNGGTVNETTSGQLASSAGVTVNAGTYALGASRTQTLADFQTATGSTTSLGSGSTLTLTGTASNTIGGTVSGAGALNVGGTGTTYLLGNNTYSGGTTTTTSLRVNSDTALGTAAVTVNSGGNVQLQNGISVANNFTLNSTGTSANNGAIENFAGTNAITGNVTLSGSSSIQSTAGSLTLAGGVTGNYALAFNGAGDTTVTGIINNGSAGLTKNGAGTLTLSGANTFTGPLALNAGTVTLGSSNVLPNGLSLTIASAGTLNLNGKSDTMGSLNGTGAVAFNGGALTLTGTGSYAGSLNGTGSLQLNSGSALTLGSSVANSSLNVTLNGGTLDLNSASFSLGTLNVTANSILDFSSTQNVSLSLANLVLGAGVTLTVTNWQNTLDDFYTQAWSGATYDTRGSSPMNRVVFSGYSGNSTAWLSFDQQVTPVPEPSFYGALLTVIGAGLLAWRRRSRT